MLENALNMRNISYGKKITCKTLLSVGLIALAVVLPQFVHLVLGQPGGVQWLPMYLPVLIGGCLFGTKWGIGVGLLSPIVSFIITSAIGNPMPMAERLPFMMAELAVFAAVSGLFTKKTADNGFWAFPAVIIAQLTGRAVFLVLAAIFNSFVSFTPAMIWSQIQNGLVGLTLQAILVPFIIIGLRKILIKNHSDK